MTNNIRWVMKSIGHFEFEILYLLVALKLWSDVSQFI